MMRNRYKVACVVALTLALLGCGEKKEAAPASVNTTDTVSTATTAPPPEVEKIEATPEAVAKAKEDLQDLADRDRRMNATLSFEDFKGKVYKEPFENGKYIVNGDTTITNEKQLREFYDQNVKTPQIMMLLINRISGMDDKWNQQTKRNLKYCVSKSFGSRHAEVVQQMASATGVWEKVANVDFTHDASQDTNCTPSNAAVVFDVRPVNLGEYLARAFFPNESRVTRNVLIDDSSFNPSSDNLKLVGILRHELGHTLGFRHEHTRPESGACFEDNDWKPLTSYDAFSVMHYPQCNGMGDWSLNLTARDKSGAACVYGPAAAFTIDPTLVTGVQCSTEQPVAPATGQPKTDSFNTQSVAKGAQKLYGPFTLIPNSPVVVTMGGAVSSGDPDLYVRFAGQAGPTAYDCRPFLDGADESCSLIAPANASKVHVMVRGYAQGTFDLQVTRTPPATTLTTDALASRRALDSARLATPKDQ